MKVATSDRGDIIHFAGLHGLSPALRDGLPVFVHGQDASATRCGWETFFRAMGDRWLAMAYDTDVGASAEFQPKASLSGSPSPGRREGAIAHARRFVRALARRPSCSRSSDVPSPPPRS